MANWHGYLSIKQLPPFWSGAQIAEAKVALSALGAQTGSLPAQITHGATVYDGLSLVIESLFDTAELERAALVTTLDTGVTGTSEAEIDEWLDFETEASPGPWLESWEATETFMRGDTSETAFSPSGGFTIAMLPDTQYLTPAQFLTLGQWVVDNAAVMDIEVVLHMGDVVETYDTTSAWEGAVAAFDLLDTAAIPYLVAIGNHDYEGVGYASSGVRDSTFYNTYFGQARYTGEGWWSGGFYEVNHAENAYLSVTIDAQEYIFISLEFGPRDAALTWAAGIIAANATAKIIVFSHNYLTDLGVLSGPSSPFRPGLYSQCGADHNSGVDMWATLKLSSNTMMILSGHLLGNGTGRLVSDGDNANRVNQMLAGHIKSGGSTKGCVRLINIRPNDSAISCRTYDTILGLWLTSPENAFELAA